MKIFKKTYYQKNLMKQIYFIITLIITLAIWILPLNSEITFNIRNWGFFNYN